MPAQLEPGSSDRNRASRDAGPRPEVVAGLVLERPNPYLDQAFVERLTYRRIRYFLAFNVPYAITALIAALIALTIILPLEAAWQWGWLCCFIAVIMAGFYGHIRFTREQRIENLNPTKWWRFYAVFAFTQGSVIGWIPELAATGGHSEDILILLDILVLFWMLIGGMWLVLFFRHVLVLIMGLTIGLAFSSTGKLLGGEYIYLLFMLVPPLAITLCFSMNYIYTMQALTNTALQRSNEELAVLMSELQHSMQDWIFKTDENHHIHDIPPAMRKALNLSDVDGSLKLVDIFITDPEGMRNLRAALAAHAPLRDLTLELKTNSKPRYWRLRGRVARGQSGDFAGYRIIASDVTESISLRSKAEKRAREEAAQQMSSRVANALNNHLSATAGSLELLRLGADSDEDQEKILEAGRASAEQAAKLVEALALYASMSPSMHAQPVDLEAIMHRVLNRLRPDYSEKLDFQVNAEKGVVAAVNPEMLQHALEHLLDNAARASGSKGRIEIFISRREHPNPIAEIRVKDQGEGFPEEALSKAFEPYYTSNTAGGSIGIGLAIVERFANQSGGKAIMRNHGNGAEIILQLPFAGAGARNPAPSQATMRQQRPLMGRSILVIGDDPIIRTSLRSELKAMGAALNHMVSMRELQETKDKLHKIDIILASLELNDGTSLDAVEALVSIDPKRIIPLIYLSPQEGAYLSDGIPCLTAPFSRERIISSIEEAIEQTNYHSA